MSQENRVAAHHLPKGTVLNGKYIIDEFLGEGGFGITYKGHDKLLGLSAAIKEFFPNGYAVRHSESSLNITITVNNDTEYFNKWKEKFLNEAQTLASLNDISGIVNVRDYFEENGTAYIIMEYLKGNTLKQIVCSEGAMDPIKITELMLPLLKSLQQVHEQGLIHRDISPDNIMLMTDGKLKLFDFGAARDCSDWQRSYSIMLKPGFAPQEQYRSKGMQGPWTDIYEICATMYYCITGIIPDDSMQRVFNDELKTPSEIITNIPSYIENAIMKGLRIQEKERFQSVAELFDALTLPPDRNVVRISTPSPKAIEPFKSEAEPIRPVNDEMRTAVMPKAQNTRKTTVISTEAPSKINSTILMPSNMPKCNDNVDCEKIAENTSMVASVKQAQEDVLLSANTMKNNKRQGNGRFHAAKFWGGICAVLCTLSVVLVVIFSNINSDKSDSSSINEVPIGNYSVSVSDKIDS